MSLDDLRSQLAKLDPKAAKKIDLKNRRRVVRALEICLLTRRPASEVVAGVGDSGERDHRSRLQAFCVSRPERTLRTNQSTSGNDV